MSFLSFPWFIRLGARSEEDLENPTQVIIAIWFLTALRRERNNQCCGRIYDYWIFRSGTFNNTDNLGYNDLQY